jgi:hypothetical protein
MLGTRIPVEARCKRRTSEPAMAIWKGDIEAGAISLMIAGDLATVGELNTRARVDRVAAATSPVTE